MAIPSPGIVPFGSFLDNDSPHNFSNLAGEFLQAARFSNHGFDNRPVWPTYFLAFQALELYLKSFLIRRRATVDHVRRRIGHDLQRALKEAKAKGLNIPIQPSVEALVMKMSEYYKSREFQYKGINGQWTVMPPDALIFFVDTVGKTIGA
jgi:HEPN domain-containing protein